LYWACCRAPWPVRRARRRTPITDAKSLAGEWRAVGGASPAGKVAVVAGKGSYRSTSSEGTVTLSRDARSWLTFTRADLKGSAGLERVK
jgi:hypothetical protein